MSPASLPARPLTSRAQRALQLSDEAAATMNHDYIGTEHLLLGLLAETRGPAAQILTHLGVDADKVRALLMRTDGAAPA